MLTDSEMWLLQDILGGRRQQQQQQSIDHFCDTFKN